MRALVQDIILVKAPRWDSLAHSLVQSVWVVPTDYDRLQRVFHLKGPLGLFTRTMG